MTYEKVKDLIEILKKFDENDYVVLSRGEGSNGEWATLMVWKNEKDTRWGIGTVIMETED